MLFSSTQAFALQNQSVENSCRVDFKLIRQCSGSIFSGPLANVTVQLCQSNNSNESYINLKAEDKLGNLNYELVSGTAHLDERRNLFFLAKTEKTSFQILFTNDGDEAYVTKDTSSEDGLLIENYTLYCEM